MEETRGPSVPFRLLNPVAGILVGRIGLATGGVMILCVPRRVTGGIQRVPVHVLVHQGAYHLVSLYGESDWLRNLRAAGRAKLVRGRTVVPVAIAEELAAGARAATLRRYLQRWGGHTASIVGVDATASDDEILAVADRCPVVRLKLS